jgi:hypothetical protein
MGRDPEDSSFDVQIERITKNDDGQVFGLNRVR